MIPAPVTIAIHTFGQDAREDLIADVRAGLTATPKTLPPRWLYDERGSELFEAITQLPEYYLTRTEAEILHRVAPEVISAVAPEALVELGSGSARKTRVLIDAALGDRLGFFVLFDISESTLQQTARRIAADFPGLSVYAMVGDFAAHLDRVPRYGRQLVVFLGSTIGNFDDAERRVFLDHVRALLQPGDAFLLGVDLVKDEAELVAAYEDAEGVTAAFNRNVLRVLNRQLAADFDLTAFDHVALFNRERSRIEMHLRSRWRQRVRLPGAGLTVEFAAGELLMTEISVKFTQASVEGALRESGLALTRWYTDAEERFALCLCMPRLGSESG
jgi:L-histidine Nalpha-methyltransferase